MNALDDLYALDETSAQLLSQYVDGELSPEEAAAFEARLAQEAPLAAAFEALDAQQSLFRAHFDEHFEAAFAQVDFEGFAAGVLAQLPEQSPAAAPAAAAPSASVAAPAAPAAARVPWTQRLRALWLPSLIGAAAAAALMWTVLRPDGVEVDEVLGGEVYVESVNNDGPQTVLISQPVEEGGSTVIWLLDDELDAMDPLDSLAPEAAGRADPFPTEDTEDPI